MTQPDPAQLNRRHNEALRARIARNLDRLPAAPWPEAHGLKQAAVCLAVVDDGSGCAALVLTRRAEHLSAHAGQFALPGGRVDAGETASEAALREAREEIGLALAPAAILGRLDDYPTRSGYVITPLVVWAERDAQLQPNPAEVAAIHRVPFADLDRPGAPEFVAIAESERPVIRYPLLGTTLHAPTAALLYQFVEVALHGRPTRVAHLEQPTWAWR
jgi:8-oxo-dGTP pyrophosphatase MutT (NUDIX family)